MRFLIGVDGGGTRTTVAVADDQGRELLRRSGPPGLVDPRHPTAAAKMVTDLVRAATAEAGVSGRAAVLLAGLAGVGGATEREIVRCALQDAALAERVVVCTDGETALQGALGEGPGLLLIAGTGSIGWGRAEGGQVARCGGWGMVVGDEGGGYGLGRATLVAVLRAFDGRGPETRLLPTVLRALELPGASAIPAWAGRAAKAEIAALARHTVRLASAGDAVAQRLLADSAAGLAEHAEALVQQLGPWSAPAPLILHGGLARQPTFAAAVERVLQERRVPVAIREGRADAVTGAVQLALETLKRQAA